MVSYSAPGVEPASSLQVERHTLRHIARRLRRNPAAMIGLAILVWWMIAAVLGTRLAPADPLQMDLAKRFLPPSAAHLFGTDDFGRDVLSRVLVGSRSILIVAGSGALIGVAVGTSLGLIAAYYRASGGVLMRVLDFVMVFPLIVVALVILAVLGPSKLNVVLVVAIGVAPYNARVVRAAALPVCDREFIAAARLRGESGFYTLFFEILPNIAGTVLVELAVRLALAVFAVATLSFLGLGIQPPTPDWGLMIASGRQFIRVAPWIVAFPVLAIASLVVAVTFLGRGLEE